MTDLPHIRSNCLILCFCVLLAGCLPSSCNRIESQAISPPDSLSRAIAAQTLPDTLTPPEVIRGTDLKYPRSILFGKDDQIWAGDTENGTVFVFNLEGTLEKSFSLPNTTFPYLAGWRSDSLVIFAPETHQFHFVVNTASVASIVVQNVPPKSLQYALATEDALYLKAVTRDTTHFLWALGQAGNPIQESVLHGSSWEYAGFLRNFEGQLVSLSGFYPWALTWSEDLLNPPDTLRWRGFDSPMLRRTYAFDQGQGRGAPLITSSAAEAGEFWFVLNQRAGWLRVDVYNHAGMLRHILVEANPGYLKNFYPIDLAAKLNPDGTYQLAVALVAPEPSIHVYQWIPSIQT